MDVVLNAIVAVLHTKRLAANSRVIIALPFQRVFFCFSLEYLKQLCKVCRFCMQAPARINAQEKCCETLCVSMGKQREQKFETRKHENNLINLNIF